MAEGQTIGGYKCEFVGSVPEELVCELCKFVARRPHISDCCEARFCQACIDPILKEKEPCPSCSEVEFSSFVTRHGQKKILALQVHCTLKQRDCKWVGQLEQLDTHLDSECQYVDVECPSKCKLNVQKINLAIHLKDDCPQREYRCPYCPFKATYEIVTETHFLECPYFPLKCPNECGVTCEREIMEDHMQLCSLEEVECELSYAGCKERFLRQDQDNHMEQNAMKHVSLMAAATLRISQEFEQKLQEKDAELNQGLKQVKDELKTTLEENDRKNAQILEDKDKQLQEQLVTKDNDLTKYLQEKDDPLKQRLQENDKQIRELQESHKQVELQLQEKDAEMKLLLEARDERHAAELTALKKQSDEQLQQINEQIKRLNIASGTPPYHLTLTNYAELKAQNTRWDSEPFYTHPMGYKCGLTVWPNGVIVNYVSVDLCSTPSAFDATLPWPAEATITLELLNQHRDQDHVTITKRFQWGKPSSNSRVGGFNWTFVAHAELGWDGEKKTQYLKDDCLQLRISKVEVHKPTQVDLVVRI